MTQDYGQEAPKAHRDQSHGDAARFLVVIPSEDSAVAILLLESREQVAEFDASSAEVTSMINGLLPKTGAYGTEWDEVFSGFSLDQRALAKVYTLDV